MSGIHIYRATRGKYLKPILIEDAELIWYNEDNQPSSAPKVLRCDCPTHTERKLKYPFEEMFYRKYHLTKKELNEALEQSDYASLEMTGLILCKHCAEKIKK